MAQILDGKALATQIQVELKAKIEELHPKIGRPPGLAVLMVGDNPASATYVRNKEKACAKLGITSYGQHLPNNISQTELEQIIEFLNYDDRVDGILVQLPLPPHLDSIKLLHHILPTKDVDGLHPVNLGHLVRGEPGLRSCTPLGVMRLLKHYNIDPTGKLAVVIGRSILVGTPLSLMLLQADATVVIAHSATIDLGGITRNADIVISAVGKPNLITADLIKPDAVVVDVGINKITLGSGTTQLVGDVDFPNVEAIASYITPVPGGVGPMTVAMLLENTVMSYLNHHQ